MNQTLKLNHVMYYMEHLVIKIIKITTFVIKGLLEIQTLKIQHPKSYNQINKV